MRWSDRISATLMHHTARFTVRYGADLRFAGRDLPRPPRRSVPTRHGDVRVFEYGDPSAPAHVHLHGGAWLMRYPHMDDWWCRFLAATAGVRVLNVDFHAAPYAVFPRAQEEALDVTTRAMDSGPVSVGGFSSGGGMAAAVCLMLRDGGHPAPVLQVLGIPALDLSDTWASEVPRGRGMISPGLRELVRRAYFPDPATRSSPYASPLLAESLADLPRALVMTAELDTLRPDGDRYAARLREAGIAVWHDVTPNVDHYFLTKDPGRARITMAHVASELALAHGLAHPAG
ncbi:alpha/beta hydrolase fold domain-containing protein [Nocardioides acrostichi]|uniref:Alpha/beta hydrolase fold domain-containing protein n=1 Tax=Nocardioides acrostichi TaxID=2784339 RepID=A0A930V4H7_9ACTN|nr:alpha/beta hydrolase fold domain-containing protein [Nocardioides acrostichi]MBF4163682.1 alpha/beta hydrolase fold domain-containing protein [Nocardioides acrostichi]